MIDEFHHAVSESYSRVINHFRPKFLLGLTATPERMDYQEVFALCGNNVVYEIRLMDAIREGFLCPFKYQGIRDCTDYDGIKFLNGHYDADELDLALNQEKRAELIYDNYRRYAGTKTIGFCSSIRHADYMCDYFVGKGIRASTASSNSNSKHAVSSDKVKEFFNNKEDSVLFAVDMFNEGFDIPDIDTVMFLRPTESTTVYIQQLGRGLRLSENKNELMVLDFIGNYRNADIFPRLVANSRPSEPVNNRTLKKYLPPGCDVDYELEVIDLYKKLYDRRTRLEDKLADEYRRIEENLGRIPSRVELFNSLPTSTDHYKTKIRAIFRDYLRYVSSHSELDPIRISFIENDAGKYLNCLEQTAMSHMYKLPVFLAFIQGDRMTDYADYETIGRSMKDFYSRDNNSIEFRDEAGKADFREWDLKKWIILAKTNPVKALAGTHSEIFEATESGLRIKLNISGCSELPQFVSEIRDVVEYRSLDFKESRYRRH